MAKTNSRKKMQALGRVLRALRGGDARTDRYVRSQDDVAKSLGMSKGNYCSHLELGARSFPLYRIFDLCEAYGCSPVELIHRYAKELK